MLLANIISMQNEHVPKISANSEHGGFRKFRRQLDEELQKNVSQDEPDNPIDAQKCRSR